MNDQTRFPPQHLFWSDLPIIFNGAEIKNGAWGRWVSGRLKFPCGWGKKQRNDLIQEAVDFFFVFCSRVTGVGM